MSEAILRQDWLPQVELAFEKLKLACTGERKEFCDVIREDHGPEAEAELKAKLAAHDQAMAAKLKELEAEEALAAKQSREEVGPSASRTARDVIGLKDEIGPAASKTLTALPAQ